MQSNNLILPIPGTIGELELVIKNTSYMKIVKYFFPIILADLILLISHSLLSFEPLVQNFTLSAFTSVKPKVS